MRSGVENPACVTVAVASALLAAVCVSPVVATITTVGDIDPLYEGADPWIVAGELIIGATGDANMVISDGSGVTDTTARIAAGAESESSVLVTGAGSTWDNSVELHVGAAGDGAVYIEDAGRVTSRTGVLGTEPTGRGDVFITGPDSVWENLPDPDSGLGGDLYIGQSGYGSLWIYGGGRVTSSGAYIGNASSAGGNVMLNGPGSTWDNSAELHVGVAGWGTMNVEEGARVTSRTGVLGMESTGAGTVIVDWPDSVWEILPDPNTGLGGDLYVGQSGYGHLQIGNLQTSGVAGGTVAARDAVVAAEPNSEGLVTVIGQDSTLEIEQDLVIGAGGYGHIGAAERGQVSTTNTLMALEAGSAATVTIAGDGTSWSDAGSATVGVQGQATLGITDGGHMHTALTTSLGEEAGGTGTVLVTGPGSALTGSTCYIGRLGQGSLTIGDGGLVGNQEAVVGAGAGGIGEVLVSGADSLWEVDFGLTVGDYGEGSLTISEGGEVMSAEGYVGAKPGGTGTVMVTGPGSVWQTLNQLYIAGDESGPGGMGSLSIYNQGLVDGNSVTIWTGGTVAGDGTLRADEVLNYGTIQPGASIGTLTIDGDLSPQPDSTLEIEIDNSDNSDRVLVTGTFAMAPDGLIRPVPTQTIIGQHRYTVIEANDVEWPIITVLFGEISTPFLYSIPLWGWPEEPNSVILHVVQVPFNDPTVARTDNERSLGAALEQIAEQDPDNEMTTALQLLQTDEQARQAYDQLSGQTIPALAPVTVAGSTRYLGTVSNRLRHSMGALSNDMGLPTRGVTGRGGVYAADMLQVDAGRYLFAVGNGSPYLGDKPWGVWGRGFGLYGDRETESGVPGYQYTIYGTSFGLDYRFSEQVRLGVTGGYSEGDIDYAASRDSADVESTHVGLYGSYDTPSWYLDSIVAYGDLDYETRRYVDLLGERLEGDPSGDLYSGYLEAGLNRRHGAKTLIQPLAAFQFSVLNLDAFTETGGTSALSFDDARYESYQGSLGVKVTHEFFEHADGCRAALKLRGRWVHEFGDTRASLDAQLADVPGVVFRVSDEDISRDSALLGAGLDTRLAPHAWSFVDYGVELNADKTVHMVSAGLEYRW